jgi:hypothetical protein
VKALILKVLFQQELSLRVLSLQVPSWKMLLPVLHEQVLSRYELLCQVHWEHPHLQEHLLIPSWRQL